MQSALLDHLDVWTSAVETRSTAGRGSSNKLNLYGIKKLRELILELAVRGQLVPQNPTDEPASVLLEKIAAEKARLIKDGKLKKQEPLPPITDDEKPFELPESWEWTRLRDITQINPRNTADNELEVSFIPMPLILTSYDGRHEQDFKSWGEIKARYTHFADGDIAIAKITPCFENSKTAIFSNLKNGIGAGTTELHVARPFGENLSRNYVLLYLKSPIFLGVGESKMTGTAGQKRLPKDFFESNPLPFPPLAEQHRIVAKANELMSLCDALEQEQAANIATHQTLVEQLLAELTQKTPSPQPLSRQAGEGLREEENDASCSPSTASRERGLGGEGLPWQRIATHFDTLFTTEHSIDQLKQTILQLAVMGKLVPQDPNDEPASRLLQKIATEKAHLIKEGKIKKEKPLPAITDDEKSFELPNGWEWCRLQSLTLLLGDGLHGTPEYTSNTEYYFINGNNLDNGNILIKPDTKTVQIDQYEMYKKELTSNTILVSINGTLGKVAFYNKEKIILGKSACYFNLGGGINKFFVKTLIDAPSFIRYALSNATGSTIKNLGLLAMNNFPIALPPLAEQHRIVAKVDELMALCDAMKAQISAAQATQLQLADVLAGQII